MQKKAWSKNSINHFHFFSYQMSNNEHIERRNESFDPLHGILSNYQFVVNSTKQFYMRQRSCLMCLYQLVNSSSILGDLYSINRCVSCGENEQNTTIYNFQKKSCWKQQVLNVKQLRQRLQNITKLRNKMALELTPGDGDWLMFERSEPNVQPFWIGKALSKKKLVTYLLIRQVACNKCAVV